VFRQENIRLGGLSRVIHIVKKVVHGFDKLDPVDIVYDVIEVVVGQIAHQLERRC
jgi:hypothetical protein